MVGTKYLLFNQCLNFSSSSTFLTQRSKEDKQAQAVSGGRIDPTLLTTRGHNPNHTIYAAPRRAVLPTYISRSLDIPPLRRPTRQRVLEARQSPGNPPCCSSKALQTAPSDPGESTVLRRPGTSPYPPLFLPSLLNHWRGQHLSKYGPVSVR